MESNKPITNKIDADSVSISSESKTGVSEQILPTLIISLGILLLGFAGWSEIFRDTENYLNTKFCLPFSIGLGCIFIGAFINSKLNKFFFWIFLAIIGQAASLQMIDAGRNIHFQHYYSISDLLQNNLISIILLVLQSVLVIWGGIPLTIQIKDWLIGKIVFWKLILGWLFVGLAGAAITKDISVYFSDVLIGSLIQVISLVNIILAIWAIPNDLVERVGKKIEKIFSENAENKSLNKFAVFGAIWVFLIASFLSYFVYQTHPHVPDEAIYLFQAKYMSAGQLTIQAPPAPEAFSVYMIPTQDEKWFGIFPPAWSALLAVGLILKIEWLINPLLAGFCVLLTYIYFTQIYDSRFARIGILLLCFSPWFIFMAMSFMSHIFTLFCALSAAVLVKRSFQKGQIILCFGAGLFIGILSLTRPLDGLIVAVLLGLETLLIFPKLRQKVLSAFSLAFGTLATALLVFPYNKSVTGNYLLMPMDSYYAKYFWKNANSLGFGSDRGMGWGLDAFPGHSPFEAIINAALNTFSINIELFGWGFGSLMVVVFLIVSGRFEKKDYWAIAVIVFVVGAYSLFWYHGGPDFGARYWFLCIIPLIALTVRGIEQLSQNLQSYGNHLLSQRVILTLFLLCFVTLICYLPWRSVDKYFHYLGMRPDIQQLSQQYNFGKSLVLIRGNEHPDYESAWVYNPLNFEGDSPIFAWDKNPQIRDEVLKAFPDRKVWIVDGPTITNEGYKVLQGPIDAKDILEK